MTTHSAELMDLLDVVNIRVVQRDRGVTTVAPMRSDQQDLVRKRLLTLGEILRMQGIQPELQFDPQQS
jgi:hypothetical protein